MGLGEDLSSQVADLLRRRWTRRDGRKVPEQQDIQLGNDGINLIGTVLYADLAGSTSLVDTKKDEFAAEIYKSFLHCAAKIIRSESGTITAYDGDRVMAVYVGDSKNTSAVRTALKINYAVKRIINPNVAKHYNSNYEVKHTVGIDSSSLLVARTGIRGSNDLVWVGRAANYAAKLCTLSAEYPTRITKHVFDNMHTSVRESNGSAMWEQVSWTPMNNLQICRSRYWWAI